MKRVIKLFFDEVSFFLSLPAVVWQFLFMIMPVLVMIYFSFFSTATGVFSFVNYYNLLAWPYIKIIGRSLVFSVGTALTCLCIAYPVSYYLALCVHRFKGLFLFFLTLPFWVNFLVQIYAWFFLLEYNGLINTILVRCGFIEQPLLLSSTLAAIYLVMVYCYVPFMIMPVYSSLEKIDRKLLEASADLGATAWQTFIWITLPLSYSGIKTGFLLVMIPAFGEFVIPALLGGSKSMFVGSLISYYFLSARDNPAGAAFTCLSGLSLGFVILIFYLVAKGILFQFSGKKI